MAHSRARAAQQERNTQATCKAKAPREKVVAWATTSGVDWQEAMEVPRGTVPLHAPCTDRRGGSRSGARCIQKLKAGSTTSTYTVVRQ
jgi:hypothetical protein